MCVVAPNQWELHLYFFILFTLFSSKFRGGKKHILCFCIEAISFPNEDAGIKSKCTNYFDTKCVG